MGRLTPHTIRVVVLRASLFVLIAGPNEFASLLAQSGPTCAPTWTATPDFLAYDGPAAMTYDSARNRVVLVAGRCDGGGGSVWEHDGTSWIPGVPMPAPRGYAPIAYDAARGETVLFGGYSLDCTWDCNSGPWGFLDDTWAYDGSNWTLKSRAGPSGRMGAAMAYDSTRRLVVLHGGGEPYNLCFWDMSETWEWDGTTWTQGPNGPDGMLHGMAYDASRGRMVVGGTWFYDGAWTQGPPGPAGPYSTFWSAVAYDADRGRTLLYTADQMWELDGASWQSEGPAPPGYAADHALVYDAGRRRTVLVDHAVWEYAATITIAPPTLPPGSVGSPYQESLTASGGTGPYAFSIASGTLPPGLTLDTAGNLSGAPAASGTFAFEVVATSGSGSCSRPYTLVIAPSGCPSIQLSPPTLPDGMLGSPYQQTLVATGGAPPMTFSVSAGSLPPGLILSTGGDLGGVPSAEGAYTFTAKAMDAQSCAGTLAYTITVLGLAPDVLAGRGAGPWSPNRLRVFTAAGLPTIVDLLAFQAGAWGVRVGSGNLDATPQPEILAGPGPGETLGPQVRGFRSDGTSVAKVSFYAYGTLRYGVEVGAGDLDADVHAEIVTGAGPGAVFGPHVRAFDVDGGHVVPISGVSFFAYATLRYGVLPGSGDVDLDGFAELLTGPGPSQVFAATVRGFDYDGQTLRPIGKISFNAHPTGYGAVVAAGDVDGDGYAEIGAAQGAGPTSTTFVLGFGYDGTAVSRLIGFEATPGPTAYGARLAISPLDAAPEEELIIGAGPDPAARPHAFEYAYDGVALTPLPGGFDAFSGGFGLTVSGGKLGI